MLFYFNKRKWYLDLYKCLWVVETWGSFPWIRLSSLTIVSLYVETFVKSVENASVEHFCQIFKLIHNFLLPLLSNVLGRLNLKLQYLLSYTPVLIKHPVWNHHNWGLVLRNVWSFVRVIITFVRVHVMKHLQGSRPCGNFQILKNLRFLI